MASNSRRKFTRYSLEQLIEYVDLYRGCFAVGFLATNSEERKRVRAGQGKHAHLGVKLSSQITAGSSNSIWSALSSLIPTSMITAAVQEFTASLDFVHCEAAFYLSEKGKEVFGDGHMLSITAQQKAPVHIYPRRFHDDYEWLNVSSDCNELRAIVGYCCDLQGKRFKYNAMAQCLTTPGPDRREKWYCSYLCATLLEFLSVAEGHLNRPNTLSIDDLYFILKLPEYRPKVDYNRTEAHLNKVYRNDLLIVRNK